VTQRPRTAVVIVTHQTCDEALTCLASLEGDQADDIVVVDTGSTDGTAEAVRAAHPDVRVLELANAGFGRGANAGVRVTSAPYVVVANADVRFGPGSVQHLADDLDEDPSLGAVGPGVFYPDGQPQASARRLPDPITAIAHGVLGRLAPANRWTRRYRALDHPHTQAREADWLSGCALALRRGAFERSAASTPGSTSTSRTSTSPSASVRRGGGCVSSPTRGSSTTSGRPRRQQGGARSSPMRAAWICSCAATTPVRWPCSSGPRCGSGSSPGRS